MEKKSPRTIMVSLTIALGGVLLGAVSIAHFMDEPQMAIAIGLCTALLSYPIASISLRARAEKPAIAVLLCVGLGYVGGVLNTALSFIVVSFIEGNMTVTETLGIAIVAGLFGFVTGGPLGLLISAVYAVLIGLTLRLTRDRSLEAMDRLLVRCSGWVLAVGILGLVGAYGSLAALEQNSQTIEILGAMSTFLLPLGLLGMVLGMLSITHRHRWVAKIRRGAVDGWAVVPIDSLESNHLDLRPLLASAQPPCEVLVRRLPCVEKGAYRTGELLEPTALV